MIVSNIEKTSENYIKQGYEIIEPPLEFKGRFEMDIQAALMNIAGISISHVTKFITYENLVKCYTHSKNPFKSNIISIGMKDKLAIKDFFIPELVPPEVYTMPLFIHEDMSLTGDRTGIGCVAAMGYRYQSEYDLETGNVVPTKVLVYKHVFSLGIQCPSGDEISFQKSREFIYYLKNELHWNIRGLSADSYQSADNKQQLITMGFEDSSIISLDRKPDGYLVLKSAINENRIKMLNIPELETELIRLERDNMTGKVDHPPDGSKDIADGLAGAIYNASLHEGTFGFNIVEDLISTVDINNEVKDIDDKQNLLNKMVQTSGKTMSLKEALHDYISKSTNKLTEIQDKSDEEIIKKEISAKRFEEVKKQQRLENESDNIEDRLHSIKDIDDGIIVI